MSTKRTQKNMRFIIKKTGGFSMQTKQDGRLGTEIIGKLMLEQALPSVLAQIVNVLYNIVDRIYIGRIPDVGS